MKKWIPTVVTAVLAAIGVLTPQIQALLAAHPSVGILLGAVYAVVKGLLPSPIAPGAVRK